MEQSIGKYISDIKGAILFTEYCRFYDKVDKETERKIYNELENGFIIIVSNDEHLDEKQQYKDSVLTLIDVIRNGITQQALRVIWSSRKRKIDE